MSEDRLVKHTTVFEAVRAHAKWELCGNDDGFGCSFFCSKCGFNFDEDVIYNDDGSKKRELPAFCERCGAVMSI